MYAILCDVETCAGKGEESPATTKHSGGMQSEIIGQLLGARNSGDDVNETKQIRRVSITASRAACVRAFYTGRCAEKKRAAYVTPLINCDH